MATERQALIARRESIARSWGGHRGPVIIAAGTLVPVSGTDQFHDFHAHPDHYYLAGASQPAGVLTFDAREGWTYYVPIASFDDRVWTGDGPDLESSARKTALDQVRPLGELGAWLEAHRGEPLAVLGNHDVLHNPAAYGIERWASLEPVTDEAAGERLTEAIAESRRAKDKSELEKMRAAAAATIAGHNLAMRMTRPGITERQLQIEVEAEFFRNGGDRTAYGSLVGGGPNGAVLHFSPTSRPFQQGEIVLMDAAAEVEGYAADVTRTFPAGARFEGLQRDLYQLVLGVQEAAIAGVRPGKEYRELHLEAARAMAAGLADLDILRGDPDDLVEQDAHALFFPHGLGHMLGLSTHDAGGCLAGRPKSDRFGLKWLRADLPLQPGYVVTIEPGVYFIDAILTDPDFRSRHRETVNWERVESLRGFGGIRIEDDVHVTTDGAEVLSAAAPKSIEAVEELRRTMAAS